MTDTPRLPEATGERRSRRPDGACRTADTRVFFERPGDGATGALVGYTGPAEERERAAKAVCACCSVRIDCRRQALAEREPYGVRGGLTAEERRSVLREPWEQSWH